MGFIVELLMELIFDGGAEIVRNRKFPKIVRYPLIVLVVAVVLIIVIGLIGIGLVMARDLLFSGLFFAGLGVLLGIFFVHKIICALRDRRDSFDKDKNGEDEK